MTSDSTADVERTRSGQEQGDHNLAEYLLHRTRASLGSGELVDADGLILFADGRPYPGPFSNGALRRDAHLSAADMLTRAESFFRLLHRPFLVWIRDHADADLAAECDARGYRLREPEQGLAGLVSWQAPLAAPAPPPGFTVRPVEDEAGAADYLDVIAEAYGMQGAPREVQESLFFSCRSVDAPEQPARVVYQGDRAVAACSCFVVDGPDGLRSGGLQWAATRAEAAGHGLGALSFAHAWRAAADLGATVFVAQSSARGTPVWQRMGFELVTRYRRYYPPPAAAR